MDTFYSHIFGKFVNYWYTQYDDNFPFSVKELKQLFQLLNNANTEEDAARGFLFLTTYRRIIQETYFEWYSCHISDAQFWYALNILMKDLI